MLYEERDREREKREREREKERERERERGIIGVSNPAGVIRMNTQYVLWQQFSLAYDCSSPVIPCRSS